MIPRLRWGIMGAAGINRQFVPGLRQAGQIVQALASRRPGAAQGLAKELGLEPGSATCSVGDATRAATTTLTPPTLYEGEDAYAQLLRDPAIDVIYVPLANHLHREAVLAALAAGRPVLCEKPLGRHAGEVAEMVAASQQSGLRLAEAFMYRYLPANRFAWQWLRPALGQVLLVRTTFAGHYDPSQTNYRSVAALGGGALLDIGCYAVHTARTWLGGDDARAKIRVLSAFGRFAPATPEASAAPRGTAGEAASAQTAGTPTASPGIDLTITALLSNQKAAAMIDCSFETESSLQRYEVVGERGRLEVPVAYNPHGAATEIRIYGRPLQADALRLVETQAAAGRVLAVEPPTNGPLVIRFAPADPFAAEAATFARAVAADRQSRPGSSEAEDPWLPMPLPPDDAWANAQALDEILRLARESAS